MIKNKVSVYQYGNTVRLEGMFYDFDNKKIDPDTIKVILYNYKYNIISSDIVGPDNRKDLGEYFYDYVTEEKAQKIYYEWYGEIKGVPSLKRGEFTTKFI